MIVYLSTRQHRYTIRTLQKNTTVKIVHWCYRRAFFSRKLPRATYIFTDLDRLNFWDLELAGRLYRLLKSAGLRVLNDPALVCSRYSLLRQLYHHSLNDFYAWRLSEPERPNADQYPVFLRTDAAHRGNLSDILNSPADVDAAIDSALSTGLPLNQLLLIQYRAQPVRDGFFRKHAIYRVGDEMVTTICVHDTKWTAKIGEKGSATAEEYDEEYEFIRQNTFGPELKKRFDVARIEFGRADFGLVDGAPQTYEINTNPLIRITKEHPSPRRIESDNLFYAKLLQALAAIDGPTHGQPIRVDDQMLMAQRHHEVFRLRLGYTP